MLLPALLLVLVVAPLAFATAGLLRAWTASHAAHAPPRWPWRAMAASAVSYVLAFNLVFLVQELGLVVPKALVPGLHPVLFHNNHAWTGTHPLAPLFQGTGALATLALGLVAAAWLRRTRTPRAWRRMLLFWIAFAGVFMALPQVVLGAISPNGDVGMAMGYFGLGAPAKASIALLALVAIPAFAWCLLRLLLASAEDPVEIADATARMRFVLRRATLPGLCAVAAIVPFRVPREWIEVALVPAVVTAVGLVWLQAAAWAVDGVRARATPGRWPLAALAVAALVLLAMFQLLLRPGIAFA